MKALSHAIAPLFVPANRLDRIERAIRSGADAIIVDLEDGLAPADREEAYSAVARMTDGPKVNFRLHNPSAPEFEAEAEVLPDGVAGIILSKAERLEDIDRLSGVVRASTEIVPLIESVEGWLTAHTLAKHHRVGRLAFGALDFELDSGIAHPRGLDSVRTQLVLASRQADLVPPLDSVIPELNNPDVIRSEAEFSHRMGFGGRLCIHPAQISSVMAAFQPSQETLAWANTVVEQFELNNGKPFRLNGKMIDLPIVERARALLSV